MSVNNDKTPVLKPHTLKKRKWFHLITPAVLHEARYGHKPEPPTHTPDELAALKAGNDSRLTRSGVIMVNGGSGNRRSPPR